MDPCVGSGSEKISLPLKRWGKYCLIFNLIFTNESVFLTPASNSHQIGLRKQHKKKPIRHSEADTAVHHTTDIDNLYSLYSYFYESLAFFDLFT